MRKAAICRVKLVEAQLEHKVDLALHCIALQGTVSKVDAEQEQKRSCFRNRDPALGMASEKCTANAGWMSVVTHG